jgi:DNA-binding MarR family transcriptional regulator/ferredoxin
MRVIVDQEKCVASGQCVLSAGAVFDQREEDGTVLLLDAGPPPELHDAVHRAAALCPAGAISVRTESSRQPGRSERIAYVSSQLLTRASLLMRLLAGQLGGDLSRTELGLLNTLSDGPRRITELAELERLKQPTTSLLVQRLEQQGLVSRERHADDGRVVQVNLTRAGSIALEDYRAQARAALSAYLAEMPDEQVEALAAATETLAHLVTVLQRGTIR